MLSTGYAIHSSGATILSILALLVVIDVLIFIYSIYCLFDCVHNNGINVSTALLLGILLFVPGFGILPSIGIIIYHHIYCKGSRQMYKLL